jgi:serine/threonine protein kinase
MAAPCNFQKIHLLAFFHLTLSLLFLVTSHAAPLSFNYDQLGSDKTKAFNFSGTDVYQDNQVLQLTKYEKDSLGRVTYSKLFHLWDINTSQVTDFTTRFSFTINTPNKTNHGDGITFYLAHPNFPLPVPRDGSGIGLVSRIQLNNPNFAKENPFVAVEFDTFVNEFDPKYDHVGIDVNSISTAYTTQWFTSMDERGYDAEVSYNSSSNNLSVIFTGYQDNKMIQQHLSSVVNLREVLPDWVEFGFTSSTGLLWGEYHTLNSWSFNSSLDFEAEKDGTKIGLVIGLSVGGAVVLICVIGLVCFVKWKLRNKYMKDVLHSDLAMDSDFERSSLPKKFTFEELARATNNFAKEHKIGEGGFGGVYKGFIKDLKTHVAIKKVSKESNQGVKEYASEVKVISQLRHKNLVQLFGWCHRQNDLLLVYEFVQNGSLDSYLFKGKGLLTWKVRYNIARGLASALLYLHEECEQCVLHRDIKPSNIMLDTNFNTKLGDFGLARLMNHDIESKTTVLAGTYGYLSPEAATRGKASRESDVYSFGVVALEIACGRKAIEPSLGEDNIYLVDWVWELYGIGEVFKACDSRLYGEFNEKEIERLMIVGLWCTHIDHVQRPMIRQVVQVLNFDAPLPTLPLQMNIASTYNTSFYSVSSKSKTPPDFATKTSTSSNSTFTGTGSSSSQSSNAFGVISPSAALLNTY